MISNHRCRNTKSHYVGKHTHCMHDVQTYTLQLTHIYSAGTDVLDFKQRSRIHLFYVSIFPAFHKYNLYLISVGLCETVCFGKSNTCWWPLLNWASCAALLQCFSINCLTNQDLKLLSPRQIVDLQNTEYVLHNPWCYLFWSSYLIYIWMCTKIHHFRQLFMDECSFCILVSAICDKYDGKK